MRELRRRVERYRDGRQPLDVRGRTVIVVDDGIATGLTDLAAVRALRARGAARIVVAVPVGPPESVALVGEEADEVVCHTIPRELLGVGRWYQDFSPVSDEEVVRAARRRSLGQAPRSARRAAAPPRPGAADRELRWTSTASARRRPDAAGGAARSRDLRARQRLEPAQPAQPRGRRDAQRRRPRNAPVRPAHRARGAPARARVRHPAARAAARGRDPLGARRARHRELPIGYFGASTGAAAALRAAARRATRRAPSSRAAGGPTLPPTACRTCSAPRC